MYDSLHRLAQHVFVRPNTDVFFYLTFLRELIAIGGVDQPRVGQYMSGFAERRAAVKP